MTRAESILASRLLEMAAAEFHEHGCNDTPKGLFEDLDLKELAEMVTEFNKWWRERRAAEGDNLERNLVHIGDDDWMEYLAHRIGEEEIDARR